MVYRLSATYLVFEFGGVWVRVPLVIRTKFWNFRAGQAQSGQKHATSDRTKGAFLESGLTYHCPGSSFSVQRRPLAIGALIDNLVRAKPCYLILSRLIIHYVLWLAYYPITVIFSFKLSNHIEWFFK